ncbi:hypothetical protein B9J77_00605 [candidate division NPL-UPA2 bacterium Unc8]|uniref:Uncharacterized protein n=1 Tax=candidate division NPL-UPA2 bacterium Unc8 TaxID=1980939 RepID=A0A399G0F0_UNCN2|nr:MAG: hypothetical protein B9J77_00605 [candidate division NPL-UPA2 bacterium Unc8]
MKAERETVEVIAFVPGYRINGIIHLPVGGRISDLVNIKEKRFVAITKASIYSEGTGRLSYKSEFINLNRDYIILIFPASGASNTQSGLQSNYKISL